LVGDGAGGCCACGRDIYCAEAVAGLSKAAAPYLIAALSMRNIPLGSPIARLDCDRRKHHPVQSESRCLIESFLCRSSNSRQEGRASGFKLADTLSPTAMLPKPLKGRVGICKWIRLTSRQPTPGTACTGALGESRDESSIGSQF
jgi:hypothetical protein